MLRPLLSKDVHAQSLRSALIWLAWIALIFAGTLAIGAFMAMRNPSPAFIGWVIFAAGIAAILYRPRYGIYLVVFFALMGDAYLWPWYPFTKNFSSWESLFFVNNALIISPLETYLTLTVASWLLHMLARRDYRFFTGPLFWPAMVFLAAVVFGFAYGVYRQSDLVIGLWELRPVVYMLIMLFLSSNLIERREHAIHLLWFAAAAVFIEGVAGTLHYTVDLKGNLEGIAQITEHAVAIHMNSIFIFAAGLWIYRAPRAKRSLILVTLPFLLITYLATQRRAAFLSLMIAFIVLLAIIYLDHRRLFWAIAPPLIILGGIYLAVFWNSDAGGLIKLPVDAVKSVITPRQASTGDQSSNIYRAIENYNLSFTVHQHPLTGVGFGRRFYVAIPMADISFFSWWQYLSHNSIIWVWLKTGVLGFIAFLFLISAALMQSAYTLRRMPHNELGAVMLTCSLYLLMHFIYAYADISWDARSMVYVGAMMGLANCMVHVVAQPVPLAKKRWPWQPDPAPVPGLIAVPGNKEG